MGIMRLRSGSVETHTKLMVLSLASDYILLTVAEEDHEKSNPCCGFLYSYISGSCPGSVYLAFGLPQAKNYVQKRASSYDRSGGNADYREIGAGETLTLLDEAGPALISHIWVTLAR